MRNQRGITMIALTIMIILLIILASVTVTGSTKVIQDAQLESSETEMLTLKAKAKGFAEDIDSKTWNIEENKEIKKAEFFESLYGMSALNTTEDYNLSVSDPVFYKITALTLEKMGISGIDANKYLIVYSESDYTNMDIVLVEGLKYKKIMYYTLSEMEAIE